MGLVSNILMLIIIVLLVVVFYSKITSTLELISTLISHYHVGSNLNFPNVTSQSNPNVSSGPLINYTLSLINKDRATYGLKNVTLSPITSAQQHSESMLQYNYFSHWDIYGMKPYMRYTLLNGTGAVQENIAYTKSGIKTCIASYCSTFGNLNVTNSLSQMEYNMMYNDSGCCNNGHRDNILDPNHNQVSLGVAYNSTSIYLVEDFIDNYITWFNNTPSVNGTEVNLKGSLNSSYQLSSVEVLYDPTVTMMSQAQLNQTSDYGYGQAIAGVVSSPLDYYPSISTIIADTYYTKGTDFLVAFNVSKIITQYGAGEYTITIWLNGTSSNSSFVGSSYTIFVNQADQIYLPGNV